MKGKTLLCLALVTSMLLSVVMIGPVGAPSTTMGVEPDSIVDPSLDPGSTFTVSIWVRDVVDLAGPEFKLGYDTAVLTATEIVDGGIYEEYFPLISEIYDAEGYLHYSVMELTGLVSFDGDGIIANITFTVNSVGESALDLYDTVLGDSAGDPIAHTAIDGYFSNVIVVETGTINGTVTDSSTGDPIEGASVTADGNSATTDVNGYYTISGLTPGGYTVEASAAGYQTASQTDVTVVAGETTTVDFALNLLPTETGTIAGTVTDALTGDPIFDVTVTANGYTASTDLSGAYVISDVPVGTYTVEASAAGYQTASQTDVTVVAGETTTINFQLEPVVTEEVTIDALIAQVEDFYEQGEIDESEIKTSLIDKLYAAKAKTEVGKTKTAKNILGAFIRHLKAQSGKHVSTDAADILIADAQFIINNL